MFVVMVPDSFVSERKYIIDLIFSKWFELEYQIEFWDHNSITIFHSGDKETYIIMPDSFFSVVGERWLEKDSLMNMSIEAAEIPENLGKVSLIEQNIPVLFGNAHPPQHNTNEEIKWMNKFPFFCFDESIIYFGIDVFGSAFFMLSRYEEAICDIKDEHQRFSANSSIAAKSGFVFRPIIDEYIEVFWSIMKKLWPKIERVRHQYEILVSHDVDSPSQCAFSSPLQLIRGILGDILIRRDLSSAINRPKIWMQTKEELHPSDPYNTFEWLMNFSESQNIKSTFFFMCGRTSKIHDSDYTIGNSIIRKLLRDIYKRGHEIGIHFSYGTYNNLIAIGNETKTLKHVFREEGIKQYQLKSRMHMLRWETPITMDLLDVIGVDWDSTLGFADMAGFRCGTCKEYYGYNVIEKKRLNLLIQPLIAMECSIIADRYMGLGLSDDALNKFLELKRAVQIVNGKFTLLWHNSSLNSSREKSIYKAIIDS